MKYQVNVRSGLIQCETASQAIALAREITATQHRAVSTSQYSDEDADALSRSIRTLGDGCRRFVKAFVQNPDGFTAERLTEELGLKSPEGVISAVKGALKRGGIQFSDVFDESKEGGRSFRIRPVVFGQVKKALEIQ
jgi:hypothetical protein